MSKSKLIHVVYRWSNSYGEATVVQDRYAPITPCALDNFKRQIREINNLLDDDEIIIFCWQRYEGE